MLSFLLGGHTSIFDPLDPVLRLKSEQETTPSEIYPWSKRGPDLVGAFNPSEKYESQLGWLETQPMGT